MYEGDVKMKLKKLRKTKALVLILCIMIANVFGTISTYGSEENIISNYISDMYDMLIPNDAKEYAETIAKPLLYAQNYEGEYDIGKGFFIYVPEKEVQETLFYFPIYIDKI